MSLPSPNDQPRQPAETTISIVGAVDPNSAPAVGGTIGPYRLMETIGEGGFGLVFVAEQQLPVRRKVAIKVIKPGMDSREVIARFEAERQALAMMDHANIARVYEAGATELGRPYFVMELVRGRSITDYCNEQRLTLRERLELFIKVCQAIQHAHQKGIIHRDIKPSNVLVTLHDGVPVVKVIDFGVAKALHQPLTEKTIYTRLAQVIGTPLYMSPEQAEMSGLDIDTRSDIYSLGVLLYELLTGTTPFDRKRLANAAFDERLRIIRHEEPPKPSTRLRQSSETLPSIAAQRRLEPNRLSKIFRGDLDWITMKALEKERTRRYETASALAADVVHYLRDEPVDASPPSKVYLLRKFARRYRAILATATAFVLLLLTGAVVAGGLAISESRARDRADRSAKKAEEERTRADENAVAAKNEAVKARQALKTAKEAERAEAAARKDAQAALERAEKSLYFASIALAERNWQANNPKRAGDLLDRCPPRFRDWEWRYLDRVVHAETMTLPGGNASYSPDGDLLAIGNGKDELITIRDAHSGKISMTLQGGRPLPDVRSLVFSPDSRRVAAICADSALRIWNLPAGRQTLNVRVRLKPESVQDALHNPVTLGISPDGGRIALAGVASEKPNDGGSITDDLVVLDAVNGKEILRIASTGTSFAFSPDGKRLATSAQIFIKEPSAWMGPITDGMRVLDANKGNVLVRFPAWRPNGAGAKRHEIGADDAQITYSPDGKWIASVRKSEIKIWDAAAGTEVRTLRGHANRVHALAFSPDSKKLASVGYDETVRLWDLQADGVVVYRGHAGEVTAVNYRPDGKFIASVGRDQTVRVWSVTAKQGPRPVPIRDIDYGGIAFNPDLRSLACTRMTPARGDELILVDTSTGEPIRALRSYKIAAPYYASLAFSRDGRLVASALKKEIQVWDAASGRELRSFTGDSTYEQRGLAFSTDSSRLAFTGPQNTIEIWSLADRRPLAVLTGHGGAVTAIAFSLQGDRAATASTDGTVRIWDTASGKEIRNLAGTNAVETGLAFSPDGRSLLASSPDNCVRVWDLERGTESHLLQGHKSLVRGIAFNPAGTRVATASRDSATRLWTWPECQEILSLPVSLGPTIGIAFAADGQTLGAACDNKGATIWDAARDPASVALGE